MSYVINYCIGIFLAQEARLENSVNRSNDAENSERRIEIPSS